jgi:hypothetical protein
MFQNGLGMLPEPLAMRTILKDHFIDTSGRSTLGPTSDYGWRSLTIGKRKSP